MSSGLILWRCNRKTAWLLAGTRFIEDKPTTNIHNYNVHWLLSFRIQEIPQIRSLDPDLP